MNPELASFNIDEEFASISSSLEKLQAELAAAPKTTNPELQQKIDSASEQLRQGRSQFVEEYKKAMAKADAQLAGAKQQSQKVMDQVAAAEKELAAPLPTIAPLPAKPPFVVDRELGQKLRQELLDRFAPQRREDDEMAWTASREVWDDWDQPPRP